jgi:hypothetical protein
MSKDGRGVDGLTRYYSGSCSGSERWIHSRVRTSGCHRRNGILSIQTHGCASGESERIPGYWYHSPYTHTLRWYQSFIASFVPSWGSGRRSTVNFIVVSLFEAWSSVSDSDRTARLICERMRRIWRTGNRLIRPPFDRKAVIGSINSVGRCRARSRFGRQTCKVPTR